MYRHGCESLPSVHFSKAVAERRILHGRMSLVKAESPPWLQLQMDMTAIVPVSAGDPKFWALVTSFPPCPFRQKEIVACRCSCWGGPQLSHFLR